MSTIKRGILLLLSTICLVQVHSGETTYFLVGEPPGRALCRDSYVLPLSKQEDIDYARYLISLGRSVFEDPPKMALVGARVGPGKDGINRYYVDPTFPEWSWHVIEFQEFADVTLIIQDGCATSVENDPAWYLGDARQGLIGFWNFTIIRELGPAPLYLSIIPDGQNFQFYWSCVGTNYVYTLEGKESLAGTNWFAIPGTSWPLKTNHWTLPLTNAPGPFYQVKAEQAN